MRKVADSGLIGCVSLMLAAILGLGVPWVQPIKGGQPQGLNGQGDIHAANLCDHLSDPQGNAFGIEGKCPRTGSSAGVAKGDFNGDGIADLAIGVPLKEIPTKNVPLGLTDAGEVIVVYGSSSQGLTVTASGIPRAQVWHRDTSGILGDPRAFAHFGAALAAGDFNGDGFSDLAVASPGDTGGGAVNVIFGSGIGLTSTGNQLLTGAQIFAVGSGSGVGGSLAWGDFDGDGFGDLVVAGETGGFIAIPAQVTILFGSSTGPSIFRVQRFNVLSTGVRADSGIGADLTLAAGKLNNDLFDDLVVGAPHAPVGSSLQAGEVHIAFGSSVGVVVNETTQLLNQDQLGVPDVAETGDAFGSALAIGDFNGDGIGDLAVGTPGEDLELSTRIPQTIQDAGVVEVFFGSTTGITRTNSQLWTQSQIFGASVQPESGSSSEAGDRFGSALAAGDFNGDGRADLAIGAPFEKVVSNGQNFVDAGEVDVIFGSSSGLSITAHKTRTLSPASPLAGERFGTTLTAWNFDGLRDPATGSPGTVGTADLAIGAPNLAFQGFTNGGAVIVLYGSKSQNDLTQSGNQVWIQESFGLSSAAGDFFGGALY